MNSRDSGSPGGSRDFRPRKSGVKMLPFPKIRLHVQAQFQQGFVFFVQHDVQGKGAHFSRGWTSGIQGTQGVQTTSDQGSQVWNCLHCKNKQFCMCKRSFSKAWFCPARCARQRCALLTGMDFRDSGDPGRSDDFRPRESGVKLLAFQKQVKLLAFQKQISIRNTQIFLFIRLFLSFYKNRITQ